MKEMYKDFPLEVYLNHPTEKMLNNKFNDSFGEEVDSSNYLEEENRPDILIRETESMR